jgi:hypothetical protein
VAEACPDLVGQINGQPETLHYKQITVMLLNEFLKEHKKVEEQQASIADLKSTVALQRKRDAGSYCAAQRAGSSNPKG